MKTEQEKYDEAYAKYEKATKAHKGAVVKNIKPFVSKQQLRDKISNLEKLRKWDAEDMATLFKRAKRDEFALWCSLATIFAIVVMEVVL